jgi:hypothetical protein
MFDFKEEVLFHLDPRCCNISHCFPSGFVCGMERFLQMFTQVAVPITVFQRNVKLVPMSFSSEDRKG